MKLAILLLLVVALIVVAAPPQTNPDEHIVTHSPRAAQQQKAAGTAVQVAPAIDQQEAEAMRKDIQQMRVLLNQMRTNLAFVQSSDTPLKHQFALNNDMWQLLLNDMERRLGKK